MSVTPGSIPSTPSTEGATCFIQLYKIRWLLEEANSLLILHVQIEIQVHSRCYCSTFMQIYAYLNHSFTCKWFLDLKPFKETFIGTNEYTNHSFNIFVLTLKSNTNRFKIPMWLPWQHGTESRELKFWLNLKRKSRKILRIKQQKLIKLFRLS